MPILRTEDWTITQDWGTSTCVVEVRPDYHQSPPGEEVWVADHMLDEFGLERDQGRDVTDYGRERFVWAFDYDLVSNALEKAGWARVESAATES